MRLLIVLYLVALGVLALVAQMTLATHFRLLSDIGIGSALIPLLVIYASMELADERAPVIAGILGLLLDLTSSHRLGVSVLILSSLSVLIVTQAQKPESHSWPLRFSFVLVGTFSFYLLDYLIHQIESGQWRWPLSVWSKITFATLLNLFLCPFCFYLVGLLPRLCGWKPTYEQSESRRDYA